MMGDNPLPGRGQLGQSLHLNAQLQQAVEQRLEQLARDDFGGRLWRRDPTLWKSDPENEKTIRQGLGWLHVAEMAQAEVPRLQEFAAQVKQAGFTHVVHMGMGGSSLAPLVFERAFSREPDGLAVTILDTTDPQTIAALEQHLPLTETLFIVASKSGTTAEPQAFEAYFWEKLQALKGERAGENFVAITDTESLLARQAQERQYRGLFLNFPDIGGRYSALSYFGMVPAALQGVDIGEMLARALRMQAACAAEVPPADNPGMLLGVVMAEAAAQGRDKVTFLIPDEMAAFGLWLEQLLAESTGKEGKGLLPVAGEPPGPPEVYGHDRLFVKVTVRDEDSGDVDRVAQALQQAGHPVVSIEMGDRLDLGQEFLRWEIAVATAGAVLGINPFDQPNVQGSKDNTNRLLQQVENEGRLPETEALQSAGPLTLYGRVAPQGSLAETLAAFLGQAQEGEYVGLMAYLPPSPETDETLRGLQGRLRDALRVAVTCGYGPRFLHSTGQYHKGGPNTGVFLQLTLSPQVHVAVPGKPYDFGVFISAQALGDMQGLQEHGRRVLRVDLGDGLEVGLQALVEAAGRALTGAILAAGEKVSPDDSPNYPGGSQEPDSTGALMPEAKRSK